MAASEVRASVRQVPEVGGWRWLSTSVAAGLLLASAVGVSACSGGAAKAGSPKPTKAEGSSSATSDFDPCEDSKPVPKAYVGVLRKAGCKQEMLLTMAGLTDQLGVECSYCHAEPPGGGDLDFPLMTPRKEVANWMSQHLMSSIRRKDGEPIKCRNCHSDEAGRPVAKFLGEPRDKRKAMEWMALVMVNDFVHLDGSKLKCKDCHGGNFSTDSFSPEVILRTERIPDHEIGDAAF